MMKNILYLTMLAALAFVLISEIINSGAAVGSAPFGEFLYQSPTKLFNADSVKAVIIDKVHVPKTKSSDEQFILIYKNMEGGTWKINNSLHFWGAADKKDSVWVYYKSDILDGQNYVTFLDIKPLR